jgi:murein DD-endopeptidase MepM/ murein hydrolase activator NlpD
VADYRLPFDDTEWQLWNGNWDDPVAGHIDDPYPLFGQPYSYDFGHKNDATGREIRAARAGTLLHVRNDLTEDVSGWTDEEIATWLAANNPGMHKFELGTGSHVFIKHPDGSVASYCHFLPGQNFFDENDLGQQIPRGTVIGLAGETGNTSGPHLHFEVREFWNYFDDLGPQLPVHFEDQNHTCWRPCVGDLLASNNA